MSSRSIDDLDPRFRPKAEAFLQACREAKLEVLVYMTFRSNEEQDALYAQGRTKPGKTVTDARGGQSAHNYGLAFDVVPMVGGKPLWNEPITGAHWQMLGDCARQAGCEWGGDWTKRVDGPHVQHPNWKQLAGIA